MSVERVETRRQLFGISQSVRVFTDEIRIQLLEVERSLSQNGPSILVCLRDPGAHAGGQCAGN